MGWSELSMKKSAFLCLMLGITMLFTGCVKGYVNQGKYAMNQAAEILQCFDEKDVSSLKAMFCEKVASTHDLDKEITDAMNLYNGKSVSHDKIQVGGGDTAYHGVITDSHVWYSINNIKTTDAGSLYAIGTHTYIVYEDDPSRIGMTYLNFIDENSEKKIEIGEYVK